MSQESLYEELRQAILEHPLEGGSDLVGLVANFLVKKGVANFQVSDFLDWLRLRVAEPPSFHSYPFLRDDRFLEHWSRAAKTLNLTLETVDSLSSKLTALQIDYYRQFVDPSFSLNNTQLVRAAAAGCPFAQKSASETKRFITTPITPPFPAFFCNGLLQLGTNVSSANICLVPEGSTLPSSAEKATIFLVLGRVRSSSLLPANAVVFGTGAARICTDALSNDDPIVQELKHLRDLTIADCQFLFRNRTTTRFVQCSDLDYTLNLAIYLKVAVEDICTVPAAFWSTFPGAPSSLEPYSDVLSSIFIRDHRDFFANK